MKNLLSFILFIPALSLGAGNETYEDCILENMRGISSDVAAKAIQDACDRKFQESVEEVVAAQAAEEERQRLAAEEQRLQEEVAAAQAAEEERQAAIQAERVAAEQAAVETKATEEEKARQEALAEVATVGEETISAAPEAPNEQLTNPIVDEPVEAETVLTVEAELIVDEQGVVLAAEKDTESVTKISTAGDSDESEKAHAKQLEGSSLLLQDSQVKDYIWRFNKSLWKRVPKPREFSLLISSVNAYYADPNDIEGSAYLDIELGKTIKDIVADEVKEWASQNDVSYFNSDISGVFGDNFVNDFNDIAGEFLVSKKKDWDYSLTEETLDSLAFLPTNYLLVIHIDHLNHNAWLNTLTDSTLSKLKFDDKDVAVIKSSKLLGSIFDPTGTLLGGAVGAIVGLGATGHSGKENNYFPKTLISVVLVNKKGEVLWARRRGHICASMDYISSNVAVESMCISDILTSKWKPLL